MSFIYHRASTAKSKAKLTYHVSVPPALTPDLFKTDLAYRKACHFVSSLYKHIGERSRSSCRVPYFERHRKVHRAAYGNDYLEEFLSILIEAEIVVSDNHYVTPSDAATHGTRPKAIGYTLSSSSLLSEWQPASVELPSKLNQTLREAMNKELPKTNAWDPNRRLRKKLMLRTKLVRVAPDTAEYIRQATKKKKNETQADFLERRETLYARTLTASMQLEDEELRDKLDLLFDPQGRAYPTGHNLPREARGFLISKRNRLMVETDIGNSQPLLIGCMAAMYHGKELPTSDPRLFVLEDVKAGKGVVDRDSLPADMLRYIEICEQGEFWNAMADAADVSIKKEDHRQYFKEQLFQHVFYKTTKGHNPPSGHEEFGDNYELGKTFERLFPSVFEVIEKFRSIKDGEHKDGAGLSIAMQRLESHLVLDVVCDEFTTKHQRAAILTVHDSVVVERFLLEDIEAIFATAFKSLLGVTPKLSEK
tara:strand:- start:269 stop:1702 length:1434 start_codon:yes stop_codon:yes gene_type:complete